MIIKLQANQIPKHWETIKFCAVKAENVKKENVHNFCKDLLLNLLNGMYECFISVGEDNKILRILITSIYYDEVLEEKVFRFNIIYGFVIGDDDTWEEESKKIYDYVRKSGCNKIRFTTASKRIMNLAVAYGFKEHSKNYIIDLQEV